MTKVNTQNETMTNSIKLPRLLYGLWQSQWGLPIRWLVRKSTEIGKYLSVNIPWMPTLHTVLMDEMQRKNVPDVINKVNSAVPTVGFPPSEADMLMT